MNRPRAKGHILWLAPILAGAGAVECAAQEIPDLQSLIPQPQAAAREEGDEALKPTGTSEVRVSEYMTVDIVIQDDSITNVLHKLAVQARRNIVPSAAVDRVVNATIYDVPFYDALDGLLRPNGLGYVERGDFIYVYTNEEMAALKLDKWQPVTRIIHLDYLRPEDARDYVIKLLSPDGHIEVTKDIPSRAPVAPVAAPAMGARSPNREPRTRSIPRRSTSSPWPTRSWSRTTRRTSTGSRPSSVSSTPRRRRC